ncbi:MAG: TMEM143 family protein [Cyanobacteria bacterium P01_A01_bin.105]
MNCDREPFIPFPRRDIIQLCLTDGRLDEAAQAAFQSFCELLTALCHFQFHHTLEDIKHNYRVFNPNADVQPLHAPSLAEYEAMGQQLLQSFEHILERANYLPLPKATLEQALQERSLISLKTQVDFDDFEQLRCFYRGRGEQTLTVKKLFFWTTEKTIDTLDRLVMLIHFKGAGYFEKKAAQQRQKPDNRFTPGKIYVYFYKNIPTLDLDLLFPNIQTSMTLRDRLMLAVPGVGAAIPVLIKVLPNLVLLFAAILLAFNANSVLDSATLESVDVAASEARNIMPVLVATLTLVIALGGFMFKQYTQYKNKKIRFQKEVTDTLFFKNLANHASVFQMLGDIAEEEDCKEMILVYYHLLTSSVPLTAEALDAQIETWMLNKTGATINFDIQGPLNNLADIQASLRSGQAKQSLLSFDPQGHCQVLPLQTAQAVIDTVWDNAFSV